MDGIEGPVTTAGNLIDFRLRDILTGDVGARPIHSADIIRTAWREEKRFHEKGSMMSAGIGVQNITGNFSVGTLACFVTLRDLDGE